MPSDYLTRPIRNEAKVRELYAAMHNADAAYTSALLAKSTAKPKERFEADVRERRALKAYVAAKFAFEQSVDEADKVDG